MIDKFCEYLIKKIRKQNPEIEEERAEVILYGIQLIIGEIPKILLMIMVGFLLGVGWQTIFAFAIMLPYRYASGGFHLKTHLGCIICTNLFYCGNALASTLFTISNPIKYIAIGIITVLGMIMVSKYAPADTENVPILTKKERKTKKILSYGFLFMNMIIALLVPNSTISNIMLIGTIIQTISITRLAYKITNNQYGYKIYLKEQEKTVTEGN